MDLPEGFLEAPGADVVDIIIVDVLETVLYVSPELVDMPVPKGRECQSVAVLGKLDQFINGPQASSFHNCIRL